MDLPDIEPLRQACRDSGCHVADLLADHELDQLIGTVVCAQVTRGWRIMPPGLAHLQPSVLLRDELDRVIRNRGADRL